MPITIAAEARVSRFDPIAFVIGSTSYMHIDSVTKLKLANSSGSRLESDNEPARPPSHSNLAFSFP